MATFTMDTDRHTVRIRTIGSEIVRDINPNDIDLIIEAMDIAGRRSYDDHGIMIWHITEAYKLEVAMAYVAEKAAQALARLSD